MMPSFSPGLLSGSSTPPPANPMGGPSMQAGMPGGMPPEILAKLQALGIPPQAFAQILAHAQQSSSDPNVQVQTLRSNIMQVPGVREKLMQQLQPLNPTTQQVQAPPEQGMVGGNVGAPAPAPPVALKMPITGYQAPPSTGMSVDQPVPLGQPPSAPAPAAGGPPSSSEDPRFQGRLAAGKGLPPGQAKKRTGGAVQRPGATPAPQPAPTPGLQAQPERGFRAYREQRMGSRSVG